MNDKVQIYFKISDGTIGRKVYHEKSAEGIVGSFDITEGLNN